MPFEHQQVNKIVSFMPLTNDFFDYTFILNMLCHVFFFYTIYFEIQQSKGAHPYIRNKLTNMAMFVCLFCKSTKHFSTKLQIL